MPIDHPAFFEQVATAPGLLAFTTPTGTQTGVSGSLVLLPSSGVGAPTTLPGKVYPAVVASQVQHSPMPAWRGSDGGSGQISQLFTWGWLGSEIVYETNHASNSAARDVVAATDSAGTVGVIAAGAQVWAVRDGEVPVPTRVFFSRATENGVWWSQVPQTPGR